MATHEPIDDVRGTNDTDVLWRALRAALEDGDHAAAREIENHMRELGEERRFAHLSDAELDERIRTLGGNREPDEVLSYSPSNDGGDGATGTAAINREIKANQRAGVEATLGALHDERRRRRSRADDA